MRSDPDLCARMLRMANSAFYSFPTRVETIERAVSTIGLRQIRELLQRRETEGRSLFVMEKEMLNYTHADIGARLLELWNLPQSIWEPVGMHHDPGEGGDTSWRLARFTLLMPGLIRIVSVEAEVVLS